MKTTMMYSQRNEVIDTKYLTKLREERTKNTALVKKRAVYARVSTREQASLAVNVVGAFAAQEEVGTRGAVVTSQIVKPDLAIVF